MKTHGLFKILALSFLLGGIFTLIPSSKAGAAYDGGRLIDNGMFLDSASMSAADIQNFLSSKGSGLAGRSFLLNCYGADSKERQWYTAAGAPCDQNVPASQIIYYASQIYGVSPKAVLVTLQKEQSLVTSPNPTDRQIAQAMGYGCPTTGNCSDTSNFFYQIDSGVWVLRYHYERARGNNTWWSTSTGWTCGTEKNFYKPNLYPGQDVRFYDQSNVHYRTHYINNAATSSLYCYTPHAYNNPQGLYGLPAYGTTGQYYTGSYNFVKFFELWFGSTQRPNGEIVISGALSTTDSSPKAGQRLIYEYLVQNQGSLSVDTGVLWICGDLNGKEFAGGAIRKTLAPGEVMSISMAYTPQSHGVLKIRACGGLPNGPSYLEGYPYAQYNDHRERWDWVNGNPMIIAGAINSSNPTPLVGETVTLAYAIRNTDNVNFDSGVVWICGELNGRPFAGGTTRKTLAPGEILTISMQYRVPEKGTLSIAACGNYPNGPGWVFGYPAAAYADHRHRTYNVQTPALKISGAIFLTNSTPVAGQPLTIGYVVKNISSSNIDTGILWVCGDLNGKEYGGGSKRKTLVPGEELLVSLAYTPAATGRLTARACGNTPDGPGWVPDYPYGEYFDHRQGTFTVTN